MASLILSLLLDALLIALWLLAERRARFYRETLDRAIEVLRLVQAGHEQRAEKDKELLALLGQLNAALDRAVRP